MAGVVEGGTFNSTIAKSNNISLEGYTPSTVPFHIPISVCIYIVGKTERLSEDRSVLLCVNL